METLLIPKKDVAEMARLGISAEHIRIIRYTEEEVRERVAKLQQVLVDAAIENERRPSGLPADWRTRVIK